MSRTLQDALIDFITEEGHSPADADSWSKVATQVEDGKVVLSWAEWVGGSEGRFKTVTLDLSLDEFMERLWWS